MIDDDGVPDLKLYRGGDEAVSEVTVAAGLAKGLNFEQRQYKPMAAAAVAVAVEAEEGAAGRG